MADNRLSEKFDALSDEAKESANKLKAAAGREKDQLKADAAARASVPPRPPTAVRSRWSWADRNASEASRSSRSVLRQTSPEALAPGQVGAELFEHAAARADGGRVGRRRRPVPFRALRNRSREQLLQVGGADHGGFVDHDDR